jgi:MscS family membrane protein
MMTLKEFFEHPLYGSPGQDTVAELCWCVGILIAGVIFRLPITKLISHFVYRVIKKYSGKTVGYDKFFLLLKRPLGYLILLLSLYVAFDRLTFPIEWHFGNGEKFGVRMILSRGFELLLNTSLTFVMIRIVDFFGLVLMQRHNRNDKMSDDQLVPFFKETVKVIIVTLSIFIALGSTFHINIASLIAGLGIGGLAVALAAKESIENLLGSFTIFLDKPFVVGDSVKVGGTIEGKVESIGFRSTRIRTIEKTFLTVPNKKMVDAELDNLSLRTHRRSRFIVSLAYATNADQLKQIISEIHALLESNPHILKEDLQVRFFELGTASLNILVLYFLNTNEWNCHVEVLEEVNFGIMKIVRKNGSDFVSPTPTIILKEK